MFRELTLKQWLIILTVQTCTIVFGVTVTSVSVILPQMKGALSATQDQLAWILTMNLVATAAATPLTGWLASKLGWRRLMIGSVLGFTSASVVCGFAQSLDVMLISRVVQGALGAPIFPLGQAIILASFQPQFRPVALMMWGVGGVMGPILGPTFGGLVADILDWRWVFFMILPFGLLACIPSYLALGDEEKGSARRFDFVGFVLIAVAIGALQLLFDRGHRQDWFQSTEIIIYGILAVGGFYLFAAHATFARSPLFEGATLRDRNFLLGLVIVLVMGMLQYTPMVLFPPLLQELRGYPESVIGYLIAMRGVGNFLCFFVVAQLTRISPKGTLALGLLIQAGAGAWMGSLDLNMTAADVFWTNLIHGFGFGLAYTPMAVLTFSTLAPRLMTQGNAIFSLIRMLGSSLFIAIILLIFIHTSAEAQSYLISLVTSFRGEALLPWTSVFGDVTSSAFKEQVGNEVYRQASMIGYINAFHFLTILPAVIAPIAFFFRVKN